MSGMAAARGFFADADDLDDVRILDRDEGEAVQDEIDLDDLDRLFLGNRLAEDEIDRADDLVVIDEVFLREPLIKGEQLLHLGIGELHGHHVLLAGLVRRDGGGARRRWRELRGAAPRASE